VPAQCIRLPIRTDNAMRRDSLAVSCSAIDQ
jgi:hypothetical protein